MFSARAGHSRSPTAAAVVPTGVEPAFASIAACLPVGDTDRDQGIKQNRKHDKTIDGSASGDVDGLIHSEPIDRCNRTLS
jgi:hypothetical protein